MMPSMSKVKDILIDAEYALRAVERELHRLEYVHGFCDCTVDEIKFRDGLYFVLVGTLNEKPPYDILPLYFTVEVGTRTTLAKIEASEYGLGSFSGMELTEFVPEILQTIAEDQA